MCVRCEGGKGKRYCRLIGGESRFGCASFVRLSTVISFCIFITFDLGLSRVSIR